MKLFSVMETAFDNFDNTIRMYLSKTLNRLGLEYTNNQIFGLIFTALKGIIQNAMFYIEDALTEQNIDTALRKQSIYSLAKISGFEPSYGSAAVGTLLGSSIINNGIESKATKIYIRNGTRVKNTISGMTYMLYLPTENYVFDVSKTLVKHEFKVVQGSWTTNTYIGRGYALETIELKTIELFDKSYLDVYVNGEKWEQAACMYDMKNKAKEYVVSIGFNNTFNIMFGDDDYGRQLREGDQVSIRYIQHGGVMGNCYPSIKTTFVFVEYGVDSKGNTIDLNNYMRLEMKNCISGGSDADSIHLVRNMIGKASRNLVYANEDNFKLFLSRFSFIGYSNIFSQKNSLTLTAICTTNYKDNLKTVDDYYALKDSDILLSNDQKEMVYNTLENSKKAFAGVTLKFEDPVIRRYSVICYCKINSPFNREPIKEQSKDLIANYFMNIEKEDMFVSKSELIKEILDNVADIEAIDITFVSGVDEQCYKDGYYYRYDLKFVNNQYQYIPTKVIYSADVHPGLDEFGNISLNNKLEIPLLSDLYYYNDKASMKKSDNDRIKLDAIEFFFI